MPYFVSSCSYARESAFMRIKIAKSLGVDAVIKDGKSFTQLIAGKGKILAEKNSTLSLIPYGGDCSFVFTKGLYYPLENLTLTPADTRGISNVVVDSEVIYEIENGQALVIYERKV